MATVTAPIAVAATTVNTESWLQKFEHGGMNALDAVKKYSLLALDFVIQYTPSLDKIADAILPGYSVLADAAAATVEAVATLLRNAIVAAEKAYANDASYTKGTKLADVLATLTAPVLSLLSIVGLKLDTTWLTNAIQAIVAMLKLTPIAPSALAAAVGAAA